MPLISLLALALLAQNISYQYDQAGRLTKVAYESGKSINYTYDANGNLLKLEITAAAFTSVSAASFRGGPLAPEMLATCYGSGLAADLIVASSIPWPTELGGTQVEITDSQGQTRLAPIYAIAPRQINYLVPAGAAPGRASLVVRTAGGATIRGAIDIEPVAPGLFSAQQNGEGVAAALYLRVAGDGSRTQELLFDPSTLAAAPVDLGSDSDAVYLLLYGTGIRGFTAAVTALVGGERVAVLSAVAHSLYPGLDQVNIGPLPRSLTGRGVANIVLTVDGKAANTVTLTIR